MRFADIENKTEIYNNFSNADRATVLVSMKIAYEDTPTA